MIDISKKYQTRDGREVIIHAIGGPDKGMPVIVSVFSFGQWTVYAYPMDGQCKNDCMQLIEVVTLWKGGVWVHASGTVREATYYAEIEHPQLIESGWHKITVEEVPT